LENHSQYEGDVQDETRGEKYHMMPQCEFVKKVLPVTDSKLNYWVK